MCIYIAYTHCKANESDDAGFVIGAHLPDVFYMETDTWMLHGSESIWIVPGTWED